MLLSGRNIHKIGSIFIKNGLTTSSIGSRSSSYKIDPGTRRRTEIGTENESTDAYSEDLDYEADFANVHRSHKEYISEMEMLREKHQLDVVKQKYFKRKLPNFLTWHDKQQIKLLHNTDPEEWTVSKLSEGFPALPEIIHKILKANWLQKSVENIERHDASVRANWQKFRKNEMNDLPETLKKHLKKFTERDVHFNDYKDFKTMDKIQFNVKPSCTEFSEIITSYQKIKNKNCKVAELKEFNINSQIQNVPKEQRNGDTYIQGEIINKNLMTLDNLKKELQHNLEIGQQISYSEISIIEESNKDEVSGIVSESPEVNDQITTVKYNTGKLMTINEKTDRDYNHLMYPEKITIPKKIFKRGSTYKLNDCYYDSDGTFLYRVPGMY